MVALKDKMISGHAQKESMVLYGRRELAKQHYDLNQ